MNALVLGGIIIAIFAVAIFVCAQNPDPHYPENGPEE